MAESEDHSSPPPPGSSQGSESASARLKRPITRESDPTTWTALLAYWVEFARAGVALPSTDAGDRWRRAIPSIISLQAVTLALGEAGRLPVGERALALDRGEVLVRDHARVLSDAWGADPLPDRLLELIDDARRALDAADSVGRHWLVTGSRFVMPSLDEALDALLAAGFGGDLFGALPGAILFGGEPALFARPDASLTLPGLERAPHPQPQLQIYRQVDPETGRVARDLIAPLHASLPAGRPLLVPLIAQGVRTDAMRNHDADAWRALQERLLPSATIAIDWGH